MPPNTTVLAISFPALTAEDAQDGASAFAQAYLEKRPTTPRNSSRRTSTGSEPARRESEQIQDTSVAIARLHGPGESADRAFMMARRST